MNSLLILWPSVFNHICEGGQYDDGQAHGVLYSRLSTDVDFRTVVWSMMTFRALATLSAGLSILYLAFDGNPVDRLMHVSKWAATLDRRWNTWMPGSNRCLQVILNWNFISSEPLKSGWCSHVYENWENVNEIVLLYDWFWYRVWLWWDSGFYCLWGDVRRKTS